MCIHDEPTVTSDCHYLISSSEWTKLEASPHFSPSPGRRAALCRWEHAGASLTASVCHSLCHTHVMDGQHQEGPAPGALGDDCQETRVDGAEVVVLDAACDRHAIVAALLGGGLTEHVAELGAAVLRTPCHLIEERRGEERSDKDNHLSANLTDYTASCNVQSLFINISCMADWFLAFLLCAHPSLYHEAVNKINSGRKNL